MNIYEVIKTLKNTKRHDGEFGVEIETETKTPYDAPMLKYWSTHQDGSLRNFGIEYVLRQPLLVKTQIPDALEEFEALTKNIKFIKDSHTTSVHVHVNMLNETFRTFANFLCTYTLVENLLIRYSGPDRLSNLFCLPICDAEDTYKNIIHMMRAVNEKNYKALLFSENQVKYGALNLASFNSLGSLEIRTFRGETDIKEIKKWINIIYSVLTYARNQKRSPHTIMEDWKSNNLRILDEIFGNSRDDISYKDEKELLEKNLFYAASIAYSVRDWSNFDLERPKKEFKPTASQIKSEASILFGMEPTNLNSAQLDYVYISLQKKWEAGNLIKPKSKYNLNTLIEPDL
jgi:hypothetical protein